MPASSPEKKRKRQRPIISCLECHRRKQKCDRQQPCGNCMLRSANHLCRYVGKTPRSGSGCSSPSEESLLSGSYGGCGPTEHLEKLDLQETWWDSDHQGNSDPVDQPGLDIYNRLTATIPPRPYVMLLVNVFFSEVNWVYDMIHPESFLRMLKEWFMACASDSPPCPVHGRSGNSERRRSLSQFPSLLLQVLAMGLQSLPREHYKQMSQLNHGNVDFRTMAITLSNTACELATLLASSQATLPRVQQWFLRASFLKNDGRTIEAWHALGQGIREAQELGLHRESVGCYGTLEISSLWQREIERRTWANLYIWDRFMSLILGRPTMINDRHCTVLPPTDCDIPADLTRIAPVPRGHLDPPSSYTIRLIDYKMAHFVNEIDDLQIDATKNLSQDFIAIDSLHAKVESLIAQFPPWIAAKNRDTSHDTANPSLRAQTELTISRAYSLLVGLHRPYVFSREQSRVQIVKNGVMVIESQNRLLGCLKEHQQQLYTMSFLIFDPAVLTSAVVITSPMSLEQDLIDSALVALRTGARQLEESGRHVKIAEKGGAVLKLLVKKAEAVSAECLQLRKASRSRSSSSSLDSPSAYSPPAHLVSSSQGSPVPYSAQVLGYDSRAPWIPPPPPPSSFQCNSMEFTPSYELDEILMLADMGSEIGFGAQTIGGMEGVDIFWQNQLYGGVG